MFRPDGHVLARCTGIDAQFAQQAIDAVFNYRIGNRGSASAMKSTPGSLQTPAAEREKVLARLTIALAERVNDYADVLDAINGVATTRPR